MTEHDLPTPEDVPPVSAEALVDGEVAAPEVLEERRYPSTLGGAIYLVVLVVAVVAVGIVVAGSWRTGIRWFGGALVFAAAVRVGLRPRDAGMLAVRSKPIDATLLAGVGVALIVLASSIPDQPG
ncbi:DUF3017 domain-containing protein [uncultured Nocardioides sp.]|uniref:DUF3017 domain-containing protein n=1 Tax=uncultured Nocardioides sp. TaxID=198441 RepID=A0A6J4N373_9ACTN|nr:DUF3017 domain-containing protein [uncultured Nocardioides sp.]CAA9373705.1 MAG: hypothetical protein AVDCRST_MAG06-284 [uncultured Nocardioides sp.]